MSYDAPLELFEVNEEQINDSYQLYSVKEEYKSDKNVARYLLVNKEDKRDYYLINSIEKGIEILNTLNSIKSYSPEEIYNSEVGDMFVPSLRI